MCNLEAYRSVSVGVKVFSAVVDNYRYILTREAPRLVGRFLFTFFLACASLRTAIRDVCSAILEEMFSICEHRIIYGPLSARR